MVKVSFAFTHTHFSGLLGDGFMRKNPNPKLTAFVQLAGQSNADCFYLDILYPAVL
jgi:hypothetical protein